MSHIVLGFSHHRGKIISRLVRWFTHGDWSHVMLLEPDGRRYVESSGAARPSGVQIRDLAEFFASRPEWDFRKVSHPNPVGVWEAACAHEGAEYDWAYFAAHLLRLLRLQDPDRYVCNELIFDACLEAGHNPFPFGANPLSLDPQAWYLISEPLE